MASVLTSNLATLNRDCLRMGIKDDLTNRVSQILGDKWDFVDAQVVPETKNIGERNYGKRLTATVLYADIDSSTDLVQSYDDWFAAEVYKCFLYAAARLIRHHGGEIRSFDGDRVMGLFMLENPNTNAVKAALKLKWAISNIVNPKLKDRYPNSGYVLRHTVGIDSSEMLAVRAGIRGSNDLSWIGSSANIAAKLNSLSSEYPTWITHRVYDVMAKEAKFSSKDGRAMWERRRWTAMNDMTIYRSNWGWVI